VRGDLVGESSTRFEPGYVETDGRFCPSVALFRRSAEGAMTVDSIVALVSEAQSAKKDALLSAMSDLRLAFATDFARGGADGVLGALVQRGYEPVATHTSVLDAGVSPEELSEHHGA
jgi:hypothetical protein